MAGLALAVAMAAGAVQGAPPADDIAAAKAMIESGTMEAARELLERRVAADPRDVEALFLLGMIALANKDHRRAIMRFRQALVHAPDATRIRLELARAFYLDKDYENAFRQFQFARAGNPPPGVIASIEHYLAAIRQEKNWSYSVNLALAPDTNVNNATSARQAELFGIPFELSDDARRKSGVGLALAGSAEFAPRLGSRARLRIGAAIERREYDGTDFDDMTIALHSGPRLILKKWDLSLVGTVFRRWYSGRRLNDGIGGRVEAVHFRDARTAVSLAASAQALHYPHAPAQSGESYALFAGVTRALTPASSVTLRLGGVRRLARAREYSNWAGVAGIGYYRDLPGGFSIYLEPSYTIARHDARDPLFGVRRSDRVIELQTALLNRRIVLSRFTPRIAYTFARRLSSIDLFEFTQNRVEVGITSRF